MKNLIMALIAILAITLFSGQSLADESMLKSSSYTADQLIGLNVNNQEGKHVGKIRDVNLNAESGEINYIILGTSMLGIGEDNFAVPLEALEIQNDEGSTSVTLIVSELKLMTAPSIAAGESNEEFRVRLQNYYCVAPDFGEDFAGSKRC
jgi:sporulation protein YlmC with PRC-barrel domain